MSATVTCPTCGHTRRTGKIRRSKDCDAALREVLMVPAHRRIRSAGIPLQQWDRMTELARKVILNDLKRSRKVAKV